MRVYRAICYETNQMCSSYGHTKACMRELWKFQFFGRLLHAECSKFEETDFFSFFIYADRGSCPATPHPHGCPRNSLAVTPEELRYTVQHIHLTFMTERCMGLLARHPDKCLPHECKEVLSLTLWLVVVIIWHVLHMLVSGEEGNWTPISVPITQSTNHYTMLP